MFLVTQGVQTHFYHQPPCKYLAYHKLLQFFYEHFAPDG